MVHASELQSQITKNKIKNNKTQNNNSHVLSKFAVLHWATFIALLDYVRPEGAHWTQLAGLLSRISRLADERLSLSTKAKKTNVDGTNCLLLIAAEKVKQPMSSWFPRV